MDYLGKLYGKIGNKYFDTSKTASDFDKLEKQNTEMLEMLKKITSMYKESDKPSIRLILEAQELIKKSI